MIFEDALKLANSNFENYDKKVTKALECENVWIFYGTNDNRIEIGAAGITVDKKTGEIKDFILPSPENLVLLKSAVPIELNI